MTPKGHILKNPEAVRQHFLEQLSGSSVETKRTRLHWCDRFLKYAGNRDFDEWNKALVEGFIASLDRPDIKAGTRHNAFSVVKRVFDSAKVVFERERLGAKRVAKAAIDRSDPGRALLEIDALDDIFSAKVGPAWTFGKREMPRVQSGDVSHYTLTQEEVERLVKAAKAGKLDDAETAYLAIGSVYGLRRGELALIMPKHVNLKTGRIWVDTEKGGEKRDQLLAKEIIPYIRDYGFSVRYSPFMMSAMWKHICKKGEVDSPKGHNWHVWRRFLDTELRNWMASDVNLRKDYDLIVKLFFRWRLSSSSDMSIRYFSQHVLEADEIALAHHPVVELWS